MRIHVTIFSLALALLGASCTSNPNEVKDIETNIDRKGKVGDSDVGISDDGEVIMQEETAADDELRRQKWVNNRLQENLETEHFELKKCRNDMADPRLGGDGSVREIPEIDNMKSITEQREDIGLNDEGDLKVVKKSYFLEDLKKERKLEKSLRMMSKVIKKNNSECSRNLAQARVKAGLPAQPYKAKGYFDGNGTWVETRQAERSLDDAFEIKAKSTVKAEN